MLLHYPNGLAVHQGGHSQDVVVGWIQAAEGRLDIRQWTLYVDNGQCMDSGQWTVDSGHVC